jgi:cytochrome b pre-mRNA-processing protein 3
MKFRLFPRTPRNGRIASLYGAIVAQARAEPFYRAFGVPDTVNGRFEMVVLHAVLLLHRLDAEPAARDLGQGLFDHFCSDMDANLREMGIGDLKVPREMRRIGEAFYGRKSAYAAALTLPDRGVLANALARNVYGDPGAAGARPLAAYVVESISRLAAQDAASLERGRVEFPDPTAFVPESLITGGPT